MDPRGIEVRPATPGDSPEVLSFCSLFDTRDYVLQAWPGWVEDSRGYNLVAIENGKAVGCIRAERLTPDDAWAQAIRVSPRKRRAGIGWSLLNALQELLVAKGIRIVRGSIESSNTASLGLVRKAGWVHVGGVRRRRAAELLDCGETWSPKGLALLPAEDEAHRLFERFPVLGNREQTSRFGLVYFGLSQEEKIRLLEDGRVLMAYEKDAYCILSDPEPFPTGEMWVTSLAGSPQGKRKLIPQLVQFAADRKLKLKIDSPPEPMIQLCFDSLGFDKPGKDSSYEILENCFGSPSP